MAPRDQMTNGSGCDSGCTRADVRVDAIADFRVFHWFIGSACKRADARERMRESECERADARDHVTSLNQ